jgi:lipoprotein-anchoring transpeptidase ErfK/SrfK
MSSSRPISRPVLAAFAASVVLVGVGVGVVAANVGSSAHESVQSGSARSVPTAALRVVHLHHGHLAVGKKMRVRVANGALSTVTVNEAGLGRLAGKFNQTHTRWHSTTGLAPSTDVTATVSYENLAHHTAHRVFTIHTPAAKEHFNAYLSPAGGTVGIGEPVALTFDRAVPTDKRAAVERAISVTSKPAVVGAWHWMSDTSVHWRPPSYWKPGTKVTVSSDLQGVSFGHGVWGPIGRHSTSFQIGASHISEADQATHQMKIYDNGKLIRTFPISTGREQYPTMDGVHIALDRQPVVQMNSATVGIPKGNPDYYNETVYWDVRISNGGEFVHAAPWSVASQGFENVSHGCVNISTTNAEWFYHWSQLGDIVDLYGGVRPPEPGDAGTADWNMSWKKWLAGDAAPTAAAKAIHTSRLPRSYEPGFTPAAKVKAAAKAKAKRKHAHGGHHAHHAHHSKKSKKSGSW